MKPLRVGLIVIGGWTIAPIAWANPPETPAETVSEFLGAPIAEQPLSEQPPSTTVKDWMAQIEASQVQITGVRLEETETGLSVFLETADGTLATPTTTVAGNVLTAEIPNAVLVLSEGENFEVANPAVGIAQVSITGFPGDQVRVEIVGTDVPPTAEATAVTTGLVFAVTPGTLANTEDAEIEITVTANQKDDGYSPSNATTATKTDTPLRDIPQSIQVIPKQVIEDQQSTSLQEVLRNAPGIAPGPNQINSSNQETFFIRGFEQSNLFRNGVQTRSTGPQDLAGVERVEILRGPASVLYGQIEPGGVVNIVTKKPESEPFYKIQGEIGNYAFYRPSLDISGPLTKDKNVLYRLNAAYTNTGSFRDFVKRESIYVAPALSVNLSEKTSLLFDLEYLNDDRTWDNGVPVIGATPGDVPISRFFGNPDDTKQIQDISLGYELEHRFNENWKLRNAFRYHKYQLDREFLEVSSLSEDNLFLDRFYVQSINDTEEFNLVTDITGKFSTGPIDHVLLIGLDLRRQTIRLAGAFGPTTSINIFNPINDSPPIPIDLGEFDRETATEWAGFYIQDQISLLDNLKLLIGGRFDIVSQESENFLDSDNNANQQDEVFSPRIGIVYQPIEPISRE